MKSYTESKDKVIVDWNKELSAKRIDIPTWNVLEKYSKEWVTCACGAQCVIIPRGIDGMPIDKQLLKLGGAYGFHGAICDKDKAKAKRYLAKIEKRSAELIAIEVEKARQIVQEYGLFNK